MTVEEVKALLPSKFTIANQTITVKVLESETSSYIPGNTLFGDWNAAKNEIRVCTGASDGDEIIEFTKEQILNTFYHELIHAFLSFSGGEQDECLVCSMANCVREFMTTQVHETNNKD